MADSGKASPPPPAARVRIAGAWSGAVELDLGTWTVAMLRAEVARRAAGGDPARINLICGGKVLKDGDGMSLLQLGFKNNAKVLASAVDPDRGKALNDEAERSQKLTRLKAAAVALAERHADGLLPIEDFNIELEDQSGHKIKLGSETDQRGVMTGLMLHANAKSLIKREKYRDALDVLIMGEEAFSLCDPKYIEMVDNVPILQLDIVWCYFMLRDISCLSVAGERLANARKGFERSHGKDTTRFRVLQEGRYAELAIYLRLDLLEGVVAYHSGNFEESLKVLNSAQAKFIQLQIPDEALSVLMSMGYKEKAAKRALRMTGQDIPSAVDFLVEERAKKARRYEDDIQRRNEIMEQKKYGMTPQNKAVDIQKLNELVSIGFERYLAAEALRLNENDSDKALDLLTDPEKNCNIQRQIESRKKARVQRPAAADIEALVAMGFDRSTVMNAFGTSGTREGALASLLAVPTEPAAPGNHSQQVGSNPSTDVVQEGSSEAAAEPQVEERDEVMEDEIAKELTGDPLADYDIEVTKEGEAIAEYLSLLEAATNTVNGSS